MVEMRGVKGVFEIGADGFLLRALQSDAGDPEAIAAAIAATMRSWKKIGNDLQLGNLNWILLEYEQGNMIIAPFGTTMLVIIGSLHMACGEVLMKVHSEHSVRSSNEQPG